jgi:hypothetical protein
LTLIFVFCLNFSACEGPEGTTPTIAICPDTGNWIINGVDTGVSATGEPILLNSVEVWDSSNPPIRLGYFFGYYTDTQISIIFPGNYITHLDINNLTVPITTIRFTEPEQSGIPMIGLNPSIVTLFNREYPSIRAFFNPHSGGTWYTFDLESFPNYVNNYESSFFTTGLPGDTPGSSSSFNYYALRLISSHEIFVPGDITGPLVFKIK